MDLVRHTIGMKRVVVPVRGQKARYTEHIVNQLPMIGSDIIGRQLGEDLSIVMVCFY